MPTVISTAREKRELVDRVANSPIFKKSPRLREFLIYVADCTIEERLEDVREQQIAANVFNRKPDYNPGQDNIVRVEARSLRKRLEAYFGGEGKDEPVVISMPKGSYSLCFDPRPVNYKSEAPVEITDRGAEIIVSNKTYSWRMIGLIVVIIAAGAVLVTQLQSKRESKPAPHTAALMLPFSALIESTRDTYIVTSDTALVLIEDLTERQITLDDYISGRYTADSNVFARDPARRDLIRRLLKRRYTNAAETGVAGRIIQRYSNVSPHIFLRSGHGVQLSDFKNHDAILFGSQSSNPWVRLFADKLNFQFDWDKVRRGQFRNRSPRPGEQDVYAMTTNTGDSGVAYAIVALVPNVNGNGHVLLVGGTTSEGTEAAGDFVTDEPRIGGELRSIGIDPAGPPRHFEFLLEVKAVAGSGSPSRVLASRLISDTR